MKQFALIMEEPDAPRDAHTHWMVYGISADMAGLPEDLAKVPQLSDGIRQGQNDFGTIGYAGPRPAPGAGHRYTFQIYALDSILDLKLAATRSDFAKAVKGHILAEAKLIGSYEAGVAVPETAQSTESEVPKPTPDASAEDWLAGSRKARLDALNKDKEYILQTAERQRELKDAYAQNPDAVKRFFKRFSLTSPFAEPRIREHLATVVDPNIRRALENYVRYANRFRVYFRLKTNPLDFKARPWMLYGNKFHVKIVGGHLEGVRKSPFDEDSFAASFGSDSMDVPRAILELIDAGKATFVRIDDHGDIYGRGETRGYSLLKDLESFAYRDDGVAIIHHDAEQPYFVCIFGEKMKKDVLADLGKSLTEFQQKHFFRSRGGRPPKLDRLKKRVEVDAKPMSNIQKAVELAELDGEKKVKAEEVKLSQMRSKRRRTKS